MATEWSRRSCVGALGVGAASLAAGAAATEEDNGSDKAKSALKIVGGACSPRAGKTPAADEHVDQVAAAARSRLAV
ncbi:MAG: hypothetical protein FJ276_09805 [Planctomycetes bacterium]|nr:hypothetical protein [Planctomycetota bacterium]